VQATAKRIGDTRVLSDQLNYRLYGYHLLLAGRINQAKGAFQKAAQLNKQNPDPRSQQTDFDVFLEIISSITVK
jgi:Flp pilus assembly protein TadD